MTSLTVMEHLHVVEQAGSGLLTAPAVTVHDELSLERMEEALHRRVDCVSQQSPFRRMLRRMPCLPTGSVQSEGLLPLTIIAFTRTARRRRSRYRCISRPSIWHGGKLAVTFPGTVCLTVLNRLSANRCQIGRACVEHAS